MINYYLYGFFILALLLQYFISKTRKPLLLNIIPSIYVLILFIYASYYQRLFNNLYIFIIIGILGYGMLWRSGIEFYDSREKKIKKELEKMKTKDM